MLSVTRFSANFALTLRSTGKHAPTWFLGMWGDHDAEGVVLLVVNAGEVPIHRLGLGLGHIGGLKDGWKKRVVEYRK